MEKNHALIDSMVELLESITDTTVDLVVSIGENADFSNYLKRKSQTEMGGHIPQGKRVSNMNYCVTPEIAEQVIKSY